MRGLGQEFPTGVESIDHHQPFFFDPAALLFLVQDRFVQTLREPCWLVVATAATGVAVAVMCT